MLPSRFRRTTLVCALSLLLGSAAAAQADEGFQSIVQSANAEREAGNADGAIRDYTRALVLRPDWTEGWWNLGVTQYEANRYPEAVVSLRKLVNLAPNLASAWSILGLSEFETKDYDSALASLEKAQKLGGIDDPDIAHVSAYHLALLLIRGGEFERASTLLRSAFGDSPPPQVKAALGLATLRVPLLPSEIDPSQDALIQAAGDAAASKDPKNWSALAQQYPHTPWLHYAYGLALESAGHTREALAPLQLETEISPASALPWIEISRLSLRLNQSQQALTAAKKAVALDDRSFAAYDALAKAFAATGNTQRAALETKEAHQLAPTSPRRDPRTIALYEIHSGGPAHDDSAAWSAAMQNYSDGRYDETVTSLKNWVEHNPNDGTAWAVMGLSEFALKDYANARIHLQRGINLGLKGGAGSVQLATLRLALLLIHDGEFDGATRLLAPFAARPPLADQTQLALGLALLHINTRPDDLDAQRRELAQSAGAIVEMLLASRYADAFPAFQKLIATYPTTPWLHYAYGDALDSLSQFDDAKAQMRAELKLSPQSALPWIHLASIDVRQHLPADALKAAQTAVAMAPDSAEAHYELGRAWLEGGDAQNAITELQKANSIRPDNPEIHFTLARAYTKANQPEKAAAERATFMQLKTAASQTAQSGARGQSILTTDAK